MRGLGIKNGRLVNERPCGISGIQEAVNIKKMKKRAEKISMIAEGNRIAEINEMIVKNI